MIYRPLERRDLEQRSQEDLRENYNSLADWIQEKMRVNLERSPDMKRDQLIQTIDHLQEMY